MNKRILLTLAGTLFLPGASNASTIPYLESFTNGTALTADSLVNSSAISSYWLSQSNGNGEILTNSSSDTATACCGLAPGVSAAPAGYGPYFLVEGTSGTPTGTTFFASSNFAVTANTNYTVSFELTNVNPSVGPNSLAQITLNVNGVSLLSGVSALGAYGNGPAATNGWQTFSATWNSGSSTTASLALLDTNTMDNGNDFAVDVIEVAPITATPEPSTLFLLGGAGIVVGLIRRKRSAF